MFKDFRLHSRGQEDLCFFGVFAIADGSTNAAKPLAEARKSCQDHDLEIIVAHVHLHNAPPDVRHVHKNGNNCTWTGARSIVKLANKGDSVVASQLKPRQ